MAIASPVSLAEAVKDRINSGEYSIPVNAVRAWAVSIPLEEMADLQVTVSPGPVVATSEASARDRTCHLYEIGVSVQRQIADVCNPDEADKLAELTEAIADRFLRWSPEGLPFSWATINYPGMPNIESLKANVWQAFITITYRGWR